MEEKKNNVSNEEYLKIKKSNSKKNAVIIILVFIIVIMLILLFLYFCNGKNIDSGANKDNDVSEKQDDTIIDIITSLKRIEITDTNQIVSVNGKEHSIKYEMSIDGVFLLIDDSVQELENNETVYADFAYVTNKFIIFTLIGQDNEVISYAIDEFGKRINVDDGNYQIHNLELLDGNIEASGHIFCGLDGDCPDINLIIQYDAKKITVTPKK